MNCCFVVSAIDNKKCELRTINFAESLANTRRRQNYRSEYPIEDTIMCYGEAANSVIFFFTSERLLRYEEIETFTKTIYSYIELECVARRLLHICI